MPDNSDMAHEHWITLCNNCGVILAHCDCMAEGPDVYLSTDDVACDDCTFRVAATPADRASLLHDAVPEIVRDGRRAPRGLAPVARRGPSPEHDEAFTPADFAALEAIRDDVEGIGREDEQRRACMTSNANAAKQERRKDDDRGR